MFTYNERDLHRMPAPARTHLPTKQFIADSGILEEDGGKDEVGDIEGAGLGRNEHVMIFSLLYRLMSRCCAYPRRVSVAPSPKHTPSSRA